MEEEQKDKKAIESRELKRKIASYERKLKILREKDETLLRNIKTEMPVLEKLLEQTNGHWAEEDLVYRFYHESKKVYRIQGLTREIYHELEKISPHKRKNNRVEDRYFRQIMLDGASGRGFELKDNQNWANICRPMLEAFFHSKYFLEMAVKYGKEYQELPTQRIKSGWAALQELYGLRGKMQSYSLALFYLKLEDKEQNPHV